MPLVLNNLDERLAVAIKEFWQRQEDALLAKAASSRPDTGNRGKVTSGRHLDALVELIGDIVVENGLPRTSLRMGGSVTIPGFFRATKDWDLLVIHKDTLVAAVELKSMGSSFGNNLNNRAEEILGQGLDFVRAYERNVYHRSGPKPFLGYGVILADSPKIHLPVAATSDHFEVLPEFKNAGYAERFNLLCRKLVEEDLYGAAALILSEPNAGLATGASKSLNPNTSFRNLATALAAHVARVAAS